MAEGVAENMEMTEQVAKAKPKKKKLPVVLVFLVLISAFGSSFQYGYNLWEVNHPSADLWNISAVSRQAKTSRSKGFIKFLDALQYSFFSFGGLVGSLFAGPLMDKCGRKGSLVSNSLFSLIAAALMGWSKVRRAYEFTILARFVTGICAGIFASVVPIYLGEIAPQNMRGVIIMVAQLFVAVGVVMAQLFGHPTILGNYRDWTMYMSIIGTSALFQLFLLPSFPESPRYLLIQKRNEKKAREALKVLRGRDDVEDELEELREEDLAEGILLCRENLCKYDRSNGTECSVCQCGVNHYCHRHAPAHGPMDVLHQRSFGLHIPCWTSHGAKSTSRHDYTGNVPPVIAVLCLCGWGNCALALQFYYRVRICLYTGSYWTLFLPSVLAHMHSQLYLYLQDCPRNQEQDLSRNQEDHGKSCGQDYPPQEEVRNKEIE
ncbi:solute carrier family 2, facilitated glucose transporter member 5-like isoform X4 [Hemicordylus capensis]|uniref:solute carrier family 2, facilitated glucose transporter member 5-like isoform X4 n=1 Tax=Hemicordylus capensis TaxID=884348 RepID=UPI0023031780|nr:solute carrier family 2, facilitated glucose transporter member 5-like isoform X4 [Hemicordylus capensis]